MEKSFSLDYQYSDIPLSRGHDIVHYQIFLQKDRTGEWLCVSQDIDNFYVWKDYYGSSICDDPLMNLEYEYGLADFPVETKQELFDKFAKSYKPNAIISKSLGNWQEKMQEAILGHIKIDGAIKEKDCEEFFEECIMKLSV